MAEDMAMLENWTLPEFPIGGRDIIALGVNAGPNVARLLNAVKEQWIVEGFTGLERAQELAEAQIAAFLRESQNS